MRQDAARNVCGVAKKLNTIIFRVRKTPVARNMLLKVKEDNLLKDYPDLPGREKKVASSQRKRNTIWNSWRNRVFRADLGGH